MEGAHDRPERVNMPRDAIGRTLLCLVEGSVQIILISDPVSLCGYAKMHSSLLGGESQHKAVCRTRGFFVQGGNLNRDIP